MKKLCFILILCYSGVAFAAGPQKFYASSSLGSDVLNTGLLSTSPVQTLAKLNTLIATAAGGDSIFLLSGDVFYGKIVITRNGLQGKPIVLTSYGTGAKPIVTGLVTLSSWSNLGGNIWQATTSGVKITNNLVLRNGAVQQVGRFPNTNAASGGYLTYTAASTTSITGPALSTTTNWTGAEVAVRINRWTIRRRTVTSHAAGVVGFATMNATPKTPSYGYFFQRDARTLDQDGEWFQSATSLRMYFGNNNPNVYTVQVPNIDTLLNVKASYITVRGIEFNGASINGIYFQGTAAGLTVQNCDIKNSGGDGITSWFCSRVLVDNCTTDYCLASGIRLRGAITTAGVTQYTNSVIRNSTVNHTAQFAGMENLEGTQSGGSGNAILAFGGDSVQVLKNRVLNSGYNGIQWYARTNAYIKYNFIDSFCTARDDGGGIYTYEDSGVNVYEGLQRNIISNIIDHAIGTAYGGGLESASASGIYDDEGTWGIVIDSNTIANCAFHGIQGNNNGNMTIRFNTIFNALIASHAFQRLVRAPVQSGFTITGNIFYPYRWRFRDQTRNTPSLVTSDQNLVRFGISNNNYYSTRTGTDTSLRLQTETDPRVTSPSSFVQSFQPISYLKGIGRESNSISSANTGTLYYNASTAVRTILFNGQSYKDPKGTVYNNFVTIGAYGSVILIANGTINTPPTANAGPDKAVTLPTTTVSVTGSGTDVDGTITGYAWTKLAGSPAGGTISAPTSATTSFTALQVGTYTYQLVVTDNGGLTGSGIMRVVVSAANTAPIANAGRDTTITSPASTVTLSGSGTDAEGPITAFSWTKISGPTGGTITTPNAASTGLTGLVVGVPYVYQLTVTDNGTPGLTNTDLVQVTVKAANQAPTANAGPARIITLPVSTATLNGSGSDVDGSVVSYQWTKESGPSGGTIATPNAATTDLSGLTQGLYVYKLIVTDNGSPALTGSSTVEVTVNAANTPPVANAGTKIDITLPVNSTTLNGSGSDAEGSIISYSWVKIGGPTSGTINSPSSASTALSGLTEGVYVFELSVTDNSGAIGKATVQVEVHPAIVPANQHPTVNAGTDRVIRLPINSITTTAIGVDNDGTIASYSWRKIAGPTSSTISNPNSAATNFTNLTVGTYTFQVTVKDNLGDSGVDEIQVVVNAANQAPVSDAGRDTTITLPVSSYTLVGTGRDNDGNITGYSWSKISGPAGGTTSATTASTTVNGLNAGVYIYQLTITDNDGATGSNTMQLTVNAANIGPLASAGTEVTVTLPVNSTTLNGSGSDVDGQITTYAWTKLDGPTGGTIVNPAAASTGITGLVEGVYTYQLTVTDNSGASASASVQIKVNAANISPSVSAGADTTIILPVNSVKLKGVASDPEGPIASASWTLVNGPTGSTIASPLNDTTDVTGLIQGVYIFELTVTDGSGATATATVQITVLPPVNSSPLVSVDQASITVTMPEDSVTLIGSGSDAEGGVTYSWTGSGGSIATPTSATTVVNGLTPGIYLFTLTVTDESGTQATASVVVTVNPVATPSSAPQALILWREH